MFLFGKLMPLKEKKIYDVEKLLLYVRQYIYMINENNVISTEAVIGT